MDRFLVAENTVFSTAESSDTEALKRLWLNCFEDVPQAVDMFFTNIFEPSNCFTARQNGEIISMLFLIPCTLCGKNANYLYAACTAPRHRGKKIMSGLIDFSLRTAARQGDSYSVLLPASEGLYKYYEGLGFIRSPKIRLKHISGGLGEDRKDAFPSPEKMLERREFLLEGSAHLTFGANVLSQALSLNSIYGGQTVTVSGSYAIISDNVKGVRTVMEIMADKKDLKALTEKIRYICPAEKYILRLPFYNSVDNNCEAIDFGMIRSLDGSEIPKNIYIGITLE